jgi:hypothetical protein
MRSGASGWPSGDVEQWVAISAEKAKPIVVSGGCSGTDDARGAGERGGFGAAYVGAWLVDSDGSSESGSDEGRCWGIGCASVSTSMRSTSIFVEGESS